MSIAIAFTISRQTSHTRSGSSLVEMMAAMAGNAAIISVAIVSLIALGRADRTFRDRADSRRMVSRLAEQLREDIHAAEQVAWDAEHRQLQLTLPGNESVAYRGEKQQWSRRTISKDGEDEGKLAGAFAVPRRFLLQVEPDSAAAGETVTIFLKIRNQDRQDGDDNVVAELNAEVGRDRRLLHE
jgi:hypothetical protein